MTLLQLEQALRDIKAQIQSLSTLKKSIAKAPLVIAEIDGQMRLLMKAARRLESQIKAEREAQKTPQ